jgi:phosphoribosyl 1,2-cyclic phosphodiesterase
VSALAWWLIPLVATVLAVLFVMLRSRPAKPTTAEDSMQRLRRMQEAMERPMPSSGNVRISDPAVTPDPAPGDPADPAPKA